MIIKCHDMDEKQEQNFKIYANQIINDALIELYFRVTGIIDSKKARDAITKIIRVLCDDPNLISIIQDPDLMGEKVYTFLTDVERKSRVLPESSN